MIRNAAGPRVRASRSAAWVVPALLVVATLLASCSSDDAASDGQGGDSPSTTTEASAATEPVAFTGTVDEFYEVPEDLPEGEPGELIRTMAIDAPDGQTGWRIMYHSTDAEGDQRVATGTVYANDGQPPEGGWPVVAWDHGTSGLAAPCAPSRNPSPPPDYGVEGVLVSPDYIGLGPVGEVHPYLSAAAEGNATIDAVAAAQSMPEAEAGDTWVVAGVSQGGHAALVTGERAAERLPDSRLLGTVAMAPGSELGSTYGDQIQIQVITTMVLVGLAAEDPDVKVEDYLGPEALAAAPVISEGCVGDILNKMAGPATAPGYFTTDPRTSPAGKAWLEENDPGQVAADAPVLLVQGEQDLLVVPARTAALFDRLCDVGQVVEQIDVPTATHDTVVTESVDQVSAWIQARFAGEEPTDDC